MKQSDEASSADDGDAEARLPRKTKSQLRQLAQDVSDGKVFGTWDIRRGDEHLIQSIFMPLIFGANVPGNTMHVYEYYDNAGQRSINGYPIFFECNLLAKEDATEFADLVCKCDLAKAWNQSLGVIANAPLHKKPGLYLHLIVTDLKSRWKLWRSRKKE